MKRFKKIKSAMALLLSAVLVTSCGGGTKAPDQAATTGGEKSPTDSAQKVEIKIAWWGSDNRHEAMKKVADLYMQKNPNVTVKTEYGPWDGWQQKTLTEVSGGTEADILQVNYNWVHSFGVGENVFYDLNQLKDKVGLDNWNQEQLDAMTVNGELAAVPHGITARANFYNAPLFTEAGIEYPATYEDLIAAASVIGKDNTPTGADNKYVMQTIGKECPDLFIAQMLYDKTGKVMQTDGKVNYTVEEVTQVFDTFKSFEDAGAIPTMAQADPIDNESNPVWTSGRLGSIYEWIGTADKYLSAYKNGEAKDEIKVAPYIAASKEEAVKVYIKPSLGFAISKNTKNAEVAADYLNFMFTDEEAIKTLGTSLGISSNKATREVQEKEGLIVGAMKEGLDLLSKYETVVLDPYFEDANVRGQRYTAIEKFRTGKTSNADAAKEYIEKQQKELDELFK